MSVRVGRFTVSGLVPEVTETTLSPLTRVTSTIVGSAVAFSGMPITGLTGVPSLVLPEATMSQSVPSMP